MTHRWRITILALLLAAVAGPALRAAERPPVPEIAVIVNRSVPVTALDRPALAAIFSMARRSWGDGLSAVPLNYPPASTMRQTFDQLVMGLAPAEVSRFWIDQRIRGMGHPPRQVGDAALMLRVVANLKGSIGYVPAAMVDGSVRVVARIRGGKVIGP